MSSPILKSSVKAIRSFSVTFAIIVVVQVSFSSAAPRQTIVKLSYEINVRTENKLIFSLFQVLVSNLDKVTGYFLILWVLLHKLPFMDKVILALLFRKNIELLKFIKVSFSRYFVFRKSLILTIFSIQNQVTFMVQGVLSNLPHMDSI